MNNEQPHSGSRWEPTPAGTGSTRQPEDETDPKTVDPAVTDATEPIGTTASRDDETASRPDSSTPAGTEPDAATERIAAAYGLGSWPFVPPAVPADGPTAPRRNRGRAVVLAAAAAGLLAVGGVGGFAAGRATADQAQPVGLAGAGEYGHHRGPFGDGGDGRFGDGGDGRFGDGGDGRFGGTGTGSGSTGTST